MWTARVMTDAGAAHLKALGNREGPHALARELVGTALANWFGLPTLDYALIQLDGDVDEIPYPDGTFAHTGTAFVTRSENATTWGGDTSTIRKLENPNDVPRLVVFDTWIRNRDRYTPDIPETDPRCNHDNVLLSKENTARSRLRLLAIDHTHCFAPGDLTPRVADINNVRDDTVYGLFPGFLENLKQRKDIVSDAASRLRQVDRDVLRSIVEWIPDDWEISNEARRALEDFLYRRANFVADTIVERLTPTLWPQLNLPYPDDEEGDAS
jgi:hypothetical protein